MRTSLFLCCALLGACGGDDTVTLVHQDLATTSIDGAMPHADLGAAGDLATMPADDTAEALCVKTINDYRATLSLPALARWNAEESCGDTQAMKDSVSGTAHGAFQMCGEFGQNECPGWPGPPHDMITSCLAQMWAEGPGSDFPTHGHYINMTSTSFTKVACGFYTLTDGSVWAVQDFN